MHGNSPAGPWTRSWLTEGQRTGCGRGARAGGHGAAPPRQTGSLRPAGAAMSEPLGVDLRGVTDAVHQGHASLEGRCRKDSWRPPNVWLCMFSLLLHNAYKLRFRSWHSFARCTDRSRGWQSPPSVAPRQRAGQGHQGYPPICHTLQASSQQSPRALPLCLCWFSLQPAGLVKHCIDCQQGLTCTMSSAS